MALRSEAWVEALDARFQRIKQEEYDQPKDLVERLYEMPAPTRQPTERFGGAGTYGEIPRFTGTLQYGDIYPSYNALITPLIFAAGLQIERELLDDDQHNVIEGKPRSMLRSLATLRKKHALRPLNNAFSVDSFFYTNSENVALVSNSHTTRAAGVSTSAGFDNLITSAFSAVALEAARIQFKGFRDDRAELIDLNPSLIIYPTNLYGRVHEVIKSDKRPGELETSNVHSGAYELLEHSMLTSSVNWYLVDSSAMKSDGLIWIDRDKGEMDFVEDFETFLGKWRLRSRWGNGHRNWRFILGAQVA